MKNSLHFVHIPQKLIAATLIIISLTLFTKAEAEENFMISAANPLAAQAGYDILAKGGSAVDAAIATQLVLTLVEPQSSGIGGGAFMVHFNNRSKSIDTFDGREMAPASVKETHFLKAGGEPKKFYEAVVGGGAVGAPGAVAMLALAHKEYGKLSWAELFEAAIKLSEDGFAISPRLHFLLARDKYLKKKSAAAAYFYRQDGTAKPVGTILKNPRLAHSLQLIAKGGAKAFYTGEIAQKIIAAVQNDSTNPGLLTLADLSNYGAKKRAPVCASYRTAQICGMGPPTSGGVTSLQILKLLENRNLASLKPGSIEAINLISEASALAFADRGKFLADADFVDVPVSALLDSGYIAKRSALITNGVSAIPFKAGTPSQRAGLLTPDDAIELPSTSHFAIVDGQGNAVSMTTSVENVFGSRLMAGGFILNNQLTDFSFRPSGDDGPVNNRIQPGKRPRSSMTPTIALDENGNLLLAIGSPGGSRIIGYVTKTLIGVLDWQLPLQDAIDFPHFVNRNGTLDLEENTPVAAYKTDLEKMGYKVKVRSLNSGLHGIMVTQNGLQGGADHRREGVVLGH